MKPILFNTEMVRAILDGRKTVTRRVVKPQPEITPIPTFGGSYRMSMEKNLFVKPPCRPGEILYVRETWGDYSECQPGGAGYYLYRADYPDNAKTYDFDGHICDLPRWRPSIHMPREAARLFLRVTAVRVERLQDITEEDVYREGAEPLISCPHEHGVIGPDGTLGDMCWNTNCCVHCVYIEKSYGELFGEFVWDSTIKPADRDLYGWGSNPWVWVIKFERITKEEAEHG